MKCIIFYRSKYIMDPDLDLNLDQDPQNQFLVVARTGFAAISDDAVQQNIMRKPKEPRWTRPQGNGTSCRIT